MKGLNPSNASASLFLLNARDHLQLSPKFRNSWQEMRNLSTNASPSTTTASGPSLAATPPPSAPGPVAPQLLPERPSLQVVLDELTNFFSSRISLISIKLPNLSSQSTNSDPMSLFFSATRNRTNCAFAQCR